jgi:hypothetical protein
MQLFKCDASHKRLPAFEARLVFVIEILIVLFVYILVASRTLRNRAMMKMSQMLCSVISSREAILPLTSAIPHGTTILRCLDVHAINVPG